MFLLLVNDCVFREQCFCILHFLVLLVFVRVKERCDPPAVGKLVLAVATRNLESERSVHGREDRLF